MPSARHVIDGPARSAGRRTGRHAGARKFALAEWWRHALAPEPRSASDAPATTLARESGSDAGRQAAYDTDGEFAELLAALEARRAPFPA